jgi:glycosyltransferase involved in cell wall biosynthesis
MNPLFSVIIPVYNGEQFLLKCVHSIAGQNYSNYEAIFVDDGSTDSSAELLDLIKKKYAFVKVAHIDNVGVSEARNHGVQMASGDFILFLDADDTLMPDAMSVCAEEMQRDNLDMLMFDYNHVTRLGEELKALFHKVARNKTEVMEGADFLRQNHYQPMVWAYCYRRSFYTECDLKMLPIRHEDEEFVPRAIYLAKRIRYTRAKLYNYLHNEKSFMNSYVEQNIFDMMSAMGSLNRFKRRYVRDHSMRAVFDDLISHRVLMAYKRSIKSGYTCQLELANKMRTEGLLPLRHSGISLYMSILNLSPNIFTSFYKFIKGIR